jgi:purine-binding chemotaxis protein CheW
MSTASASASGAPADAGDLFLTFEIDGGLFGARVSDVHDVFAIQSTTPVPLARPDVAGLLNLRGRIVTAIDSRVRLGHPRRQGGYQGAMAIGVERDGESYGLIVDRVSEVLRLEPGRFEDNPVNLDARWREVSRGVCQLHDRLLVAIDIDRMIDAPAAADAGFGAAA